MAETGLNLRRAVKGDTYALWVWANDPDTRAGSRGRAPIPWTDHVRWFKAVLADAHRIVFIASTAADQPIGMVRFDTTDDWTTALLNFVVAPEARSQGFGTPMITAAVDELHRTHPTTAVFAEVVIDNARSFRVFRRAGWREDAPHSANAGQAPEVVFWHR